MPELPAAGLLLGRKKDMFGYTDMRCFKKVVGVILMMFYNGTKRQLKKLEKLAISGQLLILFATLRPPEVTSPSSQSLQSMFRAI